LTRERALELLECLFIKMSEMGKMWDFATATYYGGFSLTQAMVVGGLNSRGEDATDVKIKVTTMEFSHTGSVKRSR
ncbi:unnamed protein product, partial [marine sediment metagenome]